METSDRKVTPFLSLRTLRTRAYLGERLRMQANSGETENNDISDTSIPKPMETPRYSSPTRDNNQFTVEE